MTSELKDNHTSSLEEVLGDVTACWCRNNSIYDTWANMLGITPCHMMVLYAMIRLPASRDASNDKTSEFCQKDIAEGLGMSKQTVNGVIRDLISQGVLTTRPSKLDGRSKTLHFTKTGEKYAQDTLGPLLTAEREIFGSFNPEQLNIFVQIQKQFNILLSERLRHMKKSTQTTKTKAKGSNKEA